MNELHLFAGEGGGILGGILLGHTCVLSEGRQPMLIHQLIEYHGLSKGWANPEFWELMMDWPIGWTDLNPLEMGKFQQWLNSHGKP